MKPDHIHPNKKNLPKGWLAYLLAALFLVIILVIYKTFPGEKQFSVVYLKGKESVINWSKSYHLTFFPAEKIGNGALLAEKNDLLGSSERYFRYDRSIPDTLKLTNEGDSIVWLNGKINGLVINKDEDLLPWLQQYKTAQLDELVFLYIDDTIPPSYIPYLKKIALLHPDLSLSFSNRDSVNPVTDFIRKADFFEPAVLSIPVKDADIPALAHWKKTKCFFIFLEDSVIRHTLPPLPAMKECILYGDELDSIPPDFFANNKQLEKLSLLMSTSFPAIFKPLKQLDELVINNSDSFPVAGVLDQLPQNLSVLISSGRFENCAALANATRLKWLGLPDNISQAEFDQVTTRLKKLQVLEITGNSRLTDLHSLKELPDLRGLVIIDTVTDKKTLATLTKLRYLSLPSDSKEDSAYLKEMQKALPGCVVVANSGACLGSGWLLLLLPLSVLSGLILYKKTIIMKLPAKHIPTDRMGILREVFLVSFCLFLFAWLVSWPAPVKWIAFLPLACAGLIIGPRLFHTELLQSGLFRLDYVKSLYALTGLLMGIAGAIYYRGSFAMPLIPSVYKGFFLVAIAIGIMEELVFRGYIYGRLQNIHPLVAVTGAALIHAGYKAGLFLSPATMDITPVWLFFSWSFGAFLLIGLLRFFSNSIWPAILAHAVFDLLVYAENAEPPVWVW